MASHRIASGSTPVGETAWQIYGSNGIYVDIDTSSANFSATPIYITSLGGDSEHWATTGCTSIYRATAIGFRVYIRWINGNPLTPTHANSKKWHVNWLGIEY